jgi:hypothetical protein
MTLNTTAIVLLDEAFSAKKNLFLARKVQKATKTILCGKFDNFITFLVENLASE